MTWHWIIRDRASGEQQLVQSETCYAPYDDEIFDIAELPREIDPDAEHWDWESGAIVSVARERARDRQIDLAKAYREQRRNAPLPVWGVFPDRAVTAKMDVESRLTIAGAVQMAGLMKAGGLPFSFTFDDEAGIETTIDADQTIALGLGVAVFSGLCDGALRTVLKAIAAAFDAGATVAEIEAIDITANYPAMPEEGGGTPPEAPEN